MPELSVVVPVHNERDNIVPLLTEIAAALRGKADFEIVYVDDASKDDTLAVMRAAKAQFPELRVLRHIAQSGQSTAVRTGVKAARGSGSKRFASRFANAIRRRLLRDDTPDTGCGIKLFERAAFLDLPYFDHMHRYLPALMQRAGWQVKSVPVNHRPRGAGTSKYNNLNRALVGIADLRGVAWLIRRSKRTAVEEV
jgi:dolichol-phosphate mannosyltransferase